MTWRYWLNNGSSGLTQAANDDEAWSLASVVAHSLGTSVVAVKLDGFADEEVS